MNNQERSHKYGLYLCDELDKMKKGQEVTIMDIDTWGDNNE